MLRQQIVNQQLQNPLHALLSYINHKELSKNDQKCFKLIVKYYKLKINAKDSYGNTALHYACRSHNYWIFEVISLQEGCNFNIRNRKGKLPITLAQETGDGVFYKKVLMKHAKKLGKLDS